MLFRSNELKSVLIYGCELGAPDKRTTSTDIADLEEQALEVGKLGGREPQQTGIVVQNGTREALVSGEGVWEAGHMSLREPSKCPNALTASKEKQSGARVGDTSSGSENGRTRATESDSLINADELVGRRSGRDWAISNQVRP